MYKFLTIKRVLEDTFIFPFILIGRCVALLQPLKKEYEFFFFFPFYHIGGAEKVHSQIVQAAGNNHCIIFFTRKSTDAGFFEEFKQSGCEIKDLSRFTDNKWLYFMNLIYRGIIAGYINNQTSKVTVFNGQCNFGYKISPWIKKSVPQLELIHALNTFSYIRLPFLAFYRKHITVSQEIIDKHRRLYANMKVPEEVWQKFIFITSRIKLSPKKIIEKNYDANPVTVLYVGRDSPEKRPFIVSSVAKKLIESNYPVTVKFAGNISNSIPEAEKPFCTFLGEITNENALGEIYNQSHILIIPSFTESGPLVFMEAMARGLAIISTPVGYIPEHIKNNASGYVTSNLSDETALINEISELTIKLLKNRLLLKQIGLHNIKYAYEHFSLDSFNIEYKNLFKSIR